MLTEKQLEHYKRNIIIPEIGRDGQERLLASAALVYCENAETLRPLAYYLAALGMGRIYFHLEDENESSSLFAEVVDLNRDTSIDFIYKAKAQPSCRIIMGSMDFVKKTGDRLLNEDFIPTILSITKQWEGSLQTFDDFDLFESFVSRLGAGSPHQGSALIHIFSASLSTIEAAKICLNIGDRQEDILYYNLFTLEFIKAKDYTEILERLNVPEPDTDRDLSGAKILIVGVGGLGSPAAYALTLAGVGTLGLLDLDKVELSNLNRQVLHSYSRIGMAKTESAEFMLKKFNPHINIQTYTSQLNQDNAREILSSYDLIVAAVDNIPSRYLINDTCSLLGKPFVEAGILRLNGTATSLIPNEGHCYRCLYPNIDTTSLQKTENGVLGPLPGVMGIIEAAEAIKILNGSGLTLKNKILLFDALDMDFNIIDIQKNPLCPTCGKGGGA